MGTRRMQTLINTDGLNSGSLPNANADAYIDPSIDPWHWCPQKHDYNSVFKIQH